MTQHVSAKYIYAPQWIFKNSYFPLKRNSWYVCIAIAIYEALFYYKLHVKMNTFIFNYIYSIRLYM